MPHNQTLYSDISIHKRNQLSYNAGISSTEDRVFISAGELYSTAAYSGGSPEALLSMIFPPTGTTTATYNYRPSRTNYYGRLVHRYIWYGDTNASVGATDVRLVFRESPVYENVLIGAGNSGSMIWSLPSTYIAKTLVINEYYMPASINPSIEAIGYRFGRVGSDASDTYVGNLNLIGIEVVYIPSTNNV